jgi:hypothetical protein
LRTHILTSTVYYTSLLIIIRKNFLQKNRNLNRKVSAAPAWRTFFDTERRRLAVEWPVLNNHANAVVAGNLNLLPAGAAFQGEGSDDEGD